MKRCLLPVVCAGFAFSSCSIRQFQGDGDVLYTGVKSIDIVDKQSGIEAENALLAAEEQLNYPPNNSFFGSSTKRLPLPLYRPWLYLKYANSTSTIGKWLHRIGNKPVWLRDVNPGLRAKVAERILGEHGYLGASVEQTIEPQGKDSLEAKVSYKLRLGNLYRLDSLEYLSPIKLSDTLELAHRDISKLKKGSAYSVQSLIDDRASISEQLREHGYYYFNPSYIHYEADSMQVHERLMMRTLLKDGIGEDAMRQWRIGDVRVRFLDEDNSIGQTLLRDTLQLNDRITAHYSRRLPIRPKVLDSRIRLRPDSLYRYSQEDLTIKSLASIGTFLGPEIVYTKRPDSLSQGDSIGIMDMNILMRRDKPWSVMLGGQLQHKTTGFIGPGAVATLSRRNLFGGGEALNISATTSYEWQTRSTELSGNLSRINSYHLALDASLSFPTLLIPGWLDHYFAYPTTTTFKISGQHLNRAGYYGLNTIGFSMHYDYQPTEHTTHSIRVLGIDYSQLGNTTAVFDQILASNPSLSLSMRSQLIPSIGYTYTWTRKVGRRQRNILWVRTALSEAGNLTKAIFVAAGKPFSSSQNILGVPYSQYAKLTGEFRYTFQIDRYQSLAMRLYTGAIYSYGNMLRAPYMEQFYVGGASSIRAFTVRSLGPGSYVPQTMTSYTFMDRVGEMKLELNAEFRRKLTQSLELALFLDAGNVFLLRPDPDRLGGAITEVSGVGDFFDKIAVGTGLGLRYDMQYLLLRLDAGIGLHLPYKTERGGWYNIPKFSDGFGLHLAIGYPF